ncbi:Protein NDRG3 [Sarcoptes scabiei]|uniref:Protein NDRG3 n=1 Tax=Sarcoptes scabiei TaxID=52283 RepID=A0A834VI79_SARSC|nr:Protein NDRG3 [Sarcoptes scabiei]
MPIYYKKINNNINELDIRFDYSSLERKSIENACILSDSKSESVKVDMHTQHNEIDQFERLGLMFEKDQDRLNTSLGPIVINKQLFNQENDDNARMHTNDQFLKKRTIIMTYHDIGLNFYSNFRNFFERKNVREMLRNFQIYHINAPGQEVNAEDLPIGYQYPSMDQLSEQLLEICEFYHIQSFIGFGYGSGSNVLSRFALNHPNIVEALFVINPSANSSTWTEWFYQKCNLRALSNLRPPNGTESMSMPESVQDYFIWSLFGNLNQPGRSISDDVVLFYRKYFKSNTINTKNLSQFIETYLYRNALSISREDLQNNFHCPVAVICADHSPHVDDSIKMNARLNPENSTWIKLSDCSMPLQENPQKLEQVLCLFLQGLGYLVTTKV